MREFDERTKESRLYGSRMSQIIKSAMMNNKRPYFISTKKSELCRVHNIILGKDTVCCDR
jgi:hypothetical protein